MQIDLRAPGSGEAVLVRPGGRGGPVGDVELREDVGEVAGDGLLRQHQLVGDAPVGGPGRDQAQHLGLASGEAVPLGAAHLVEPVELGLRTERGEGGARRIPLQAGGVLVAQRVAGVGDRDPAARGVPGRPDRAEPGLD